MRLVKHPTSQPARRKLPKYGRCDDKRQVSLWEKLKRMGFRQGNQIRLYGKILEWSGDPLVVGDKLVPYGRDREEVRVLEACAFFR